MKKFLVFILWNNICYCENFFKYLWNNIYFERFKDFNVKVINGIRSEELEKHLNKKYYNNNKNLAITKLSYEIFDQMKYIKIVIKIQSKQKEITSIMIYEDTKGDYKIDKAFIKALASHINKELQTKFQKEK